MFIASMEMLMVSNLMDMRTGKIISILMHFFSHFFAERFFLFIHLY